MSYTPKNNFNLQLKRTDAGEKGFRKKLWKTLAGTCDALDYFFRWEPLFEGLGRSDFKTIEVTGGIGDFNWSVVGAGFSLDNAVTAGRTNVVRSDGTIFTGDDAVVTVVDSCGSSVEGEIKSCYIIPCGGPDLPPDYLMFGAGYDGGSNAHDGRLAVGAITPVNNTTLLPVSGTQEFSKLICGSSETLALTSSGRLFIAGNNGHGQYGDGTTNDNNILLEVNPNSWTMIFIRGSDTLVLKNDTTLWVAGLNSYGELGLNHRNEEHTFTQEVLGFSWEFVTTGSMHSLAIRSNKLLYAAGYNGAYQLSQGGGATYITTFTQVKYDDGGGYPYAVDNSNWKWAACDGYSSHGIKEIGTLWSCGNNTYGQLGLGDHTVRRLFTQIGISHWSSVTASNGTTVAIKEDGTLWGWGRNNYGQLGLGDTSLRTSPVQIGSSTWKKAELGGENLLALKSDNTLWGTGRNGHSSLGLNHSSEIHVLTQEITLREWADIAAGPFHTMALLK